MEKGRILLLGIIACVMLFNKIYMTLNSTTIIWLYHSDYWIQAFIDITPHLVAYSTALVLVVFVIVSVRRRMRENGETMTLEHLRELAFIALALALFALPWTIVLVSSTIEDFIDPEPWDPDGVLTQGLLNALDQATGILAFSVIAFISWRAYKRGSVETAHRLRRGRVLALLLIALVMQSSNILYGYGWVRYHQIYPWGRATGWDSLYNSPFWFYFYGLLSCAILGWFIHTWYRMRTEDRSMSHGQFQELAVISIGLLLLSVPIYLNELRYYIDQYILSDPPGWGEAFEAMRFYYRLSLLFSFLAYLIIGLLAMRRYKRTMPIDVVPLEEPALPPPTNAPDDRLLNKD